LERWEVERLQATWILPSTERRGEAHNEYPTAPAKIALLHLETRYKGVCQWMANAFFSWASMNSVTSIDTVTLSR
jgi:hypothetical protein